MQEQQKPNPNQTQAMHVEAFLQQFVTGLMNNLMLELFTKVLNKYEAKTMLDKVYEKIYVEYVDALAPVVGHDIKGFAELKQAFRNVFENVRDDILSHYLTKEIHRTSKDKNENETYTDQD